MAMARLMGCRKNVLVGREIKSSMAFHEDYRDAQCVDGDLKI